MIKSESTDIRGLFRDDFNPPSHHNSLTEKQKIEILDSLCRGYAQAFHFVMDYNNMMIKGYETFLFLSYVFDGDDEFYLDVSKVKRVGHGYFNFTFDSIQVTTEKTELCIPIKSLISCRELYKFHSVLYQHYDNIDMYVDFLSNVATTVQRLQFNTYKLCCDDEEIEIILERCFK